MTSEISSSPACELQATHGASSGGMLLQFRHLVVELDMAPPAITNTIYLKCPNNQFLLDAKHMVALCLHTAFRWLCETGNRKASSSDIFSSQPCDSVENKLRPRGKRSVYL